MKTKSDSLTRPAIQMDSQARIVALANLRAMCARASGVCHRFTVESVTANRAIVAYSNPNEYGSECPIRVSYPVIPSGFSGHSDSVLVVLQCVRVTGGRDEFDRDGICDILLQVTEMEQLWRDPTSGQWQTEYEVLIARHPSEKIVSQWDAHGCVQTWFAADGQSFDNWRIAQGYAVDRMRAADERKHTENAGKS